MQKNYEDKLKLFTAIAGSLSVLSANTAEAQTIVVRDINPDAVIDGTNTSYDLDIDNNGTVDFTIERQGYGYGSTNRWHFYFKGTGYIGENQPSAGMSNAHTFVSGGTTDWYVAKLNVGDVTSFTTEYNDNFYTRLFQVEDDGVNVTLTDNFQWTAGSSGYVGVQFTIGTEVHFGWVELSVANDYNSVTISRVGYETVAGQEIAAGDGLATSATTSNANSKVSGKIYASGNTLYFSGIEEDCNVTVLNATGHEVYKGSVRSGDSDIVLANVDNGVYIVRATSVSGDKRVSEKVFLQK